MGTRQWHGSIQDIEGKGGDAGRRGGGEAGRRGGGEAGWQGGGEAGRRWGGGGVTDMKMETLCKKFLKIIITNIDYYDGPSTGFFKHRAMVSGPSSQRENSRIWLSSFYIKTF